MTKLATLIKRLATRETSTTALLSQTFAAIRQHEPVLKAFITLDEQGAMAEAARLDALPYPKGPLHGVPVAIKDLTDTADLTTTYGSLLFKDHVPARDDIIVARLKNAGAIIIGKTNTPEFGFGAICANKLQGPTANPYAMDLTSGGSSGGAAAAVAAGLVPLAHGTDFGGSVRTPAGFCGIASIRPTPGLLPSPSKGLGWDNLSTPGFLARSVDDLVLAMTICAGEEANDPLSLGRGFNPALPPRALRLAATDDFGCAPVSRETRQLFGQAVNHLETSLGHVARETPDCTGAIETFHALRPALIRQSYGPLLGRFGDDLTPTVRWWIERGAGISAERYLQAEAERTALYRRFIAFFERFDVLLAPAASVQPWPNSIEDVMEIDGEALPTLVDYLALTFIVSLVGCPVVTLPTGLDANGLPFGVQLIGRPGSDAALLAAAQRLESEAGWSYQPPPSFS